MKTLILYYLFFLLVLTPTIKLEAHDIAAFYAYGNVADEVREFLFTNKNGQFELNPNAPSLKTTHAALGDTLYHPLACSGDFDGNGTDEIAQFVKVIYKPNCFANFECPPYTKTHIVLFKSDGVGFNIAGSWFAGLDSVLNAAEIKYSSTGDFNKDGLTDIAYINYNASNAFEIRVLLSTGEGFDTPQAVYADSSTRQTFKHTKFFASGDFNADGLDDIACLVKEASHFSLNVFSSNGSGFEAPKVWFESTDTIKFNDLKYMLSGNYTHNKKNDIALIYGKQNFEKYITLLESKADSFELDAHETLLDGALNSFEQVLHISSGSFDTDTLDDITWVILPENLSDGIQKMQVLACNDSNFSAPISYFETDINNFNFHKTEQLICGTFSYSAKMKVCTWQGNKQGALTFSFDDGYSSTIEEAKYLNTKGLRGTHNIIANLSGSEEYASWAAMQADTLGNEYGSHSHNHARLNQVSLSAAANELWLSKEALDLNLAKPALSFVFPGGGFNEQILQSGALRNNYLSARTSMRGNNLSSPIDFYALKAQTIVNTTPLNSIYGWIDNAESYGYWTFLMYHMINYQGSDPDLIEYNATTSDFRAAVDYAATKNLWIDTQENIAKYIHERNSTSLSNYEWTETDKLKFEIETELDSSIYNVPISIRIELGSSWNQDSVICTQAGQSKTFSTLYENGTWYTTINCKATEGSVHLSKTNEVTTAVNSARNYKLQISPNPAYGHEELKINMSNSNTSTLDVYNLAGYKIISLKNNSQNFFTIEANSLQKGAYILRIQENGTVQNSKILFVK